MAVSRTCLVTGATTGIGLATVTELARRGATVILHGRTLKGAERARARVLDLLPSARIELAFGDLSSRDEVRALAEDVQSRFPDLAVLINNAGVERWERHVTVDGFEDTWAVNHLAPLGLTVRLFDTLRNNAPARIINVSSVVHRFGRIDWDDLQMERGYGPERAYYRSKLASVMTSLWLARRFPSKEVSIFLFAPGLVRTDFGREFRGAARWWTKGVGRVFFRRAEAVAREICELALDTRWDGKTGLYVSKGRVERPGERALDEAAQDKLASLSLRAVGLPEFSPGVAVAHAREPAHAFRRWMAACTAGEFLGFGAAALWAWIAFAVVGADPASWSGRVAALGFMVLAGAAEGAVLGGLQWVVLKKWFPGLRARSWLGATMAVAALGWFIGMLAPMFMAPTRASGVSDEPALLLVLVAAGGFGALAGAAFGLAQWVVLRRHAFDAGRWIGANAVGWAIGLPWGYLAGSVGDLRESAPIAVLLGAVAGALMGASVAAVTGRALTRIQPLGGQSLAG